jgi:alpha-L-arabinofuranosidase
MLKLKNLFLCMLVSCVYIATLSAQQTTYEMVVNAKKPGAVIQPTMYGLFFEDINFGADGGLYAELIKNRSFEFPQSLMGWKTFGQVDLRDEGGPFERNPHYVRLNNSGHGHKHTGLENEGYRGIGVKKDADYRFSVWARSVDGAEQKVRVELIDADSHPFQRQEVTINSREWKRYEVTLTAPKEEEKASLRIFLVSAGPVDLEHISLFPKDTWKGRENGLRRDLVEALDELNPGLFRFPGGCIVEGTDLETRYDWKKSIGPVENRPLNENRWHYTFAHRLFPDYFQSYGMGFYELFLLSEDLGAEPLPVVNAGLACQYQNEDESSHVPVDELQEYIQDALDLIEFANGDPTTTWGKVRAEMGHPEPFNMKYIGIGNEQWGPEYPARLVKFVEAIRAEYPEIKIVGSSGPQAEGEQFEYLWPEMKRLKVDLVDEHYYRPPEWFLNQATRYDSYDRKGPAVFAGEYASHAESRDNNFESALSEAAFMTGLERNADIVHMATYAPLFAHADAWQWRPDLIWFDNLLCVRTPNYYVQKLYAHNAGTNVLPLTMNKESVTGQEGLYASAVIDINKSEVIVKVSNVSEQDKTVRIRIEGLRRGTKLQPEAEAIVLKGTPEMTNTLEHPDAIVPISSFLPVTGMLLDVTAEAGSFNVYKVGYTGN